LTRNTHTPYYFLSNANASSTCAHNSAPLVKMLKTCHADNRWLNFIAIDFYMVLNCFNIALN